MEVHDSIHFSVDTTPTSRNEIEIPKYSVKRKSTELQQLECSAPKQKQFQNFNPCWNCGRQSHSIRECDVQSNSYTVEWNREVQIMNKNHQMKKFQKQGGRYHDADQLSEHHNNFIPGPISHRLRKIMGLKENDLPSYIYRLRSHGYPVAWLKYATVKPSGINLYDKDGKEVADPNAEDGEILEEDDKIRYDLAKIVQFSGFNAPMPEESVDEYEAFRAPPYNPDQNVEHMLADLKAKAVTEYVLKKNSKAPAVAEERTAASESSKLSCISVQSEKLISTSSDTAISTISTPDNDNLSNDASQDSFMGSSDGTQSVTPCTPANERSSLGRILSSAEGTPLLQSKSGHRRLPPRENFSRDICDVINFENLPESTGKFERLRGVLRKVKTILGGLKK